MSKGNEILEELKRIRELLEPKPAPPSPKGLWNEFMDFFEIRFYFLKNVLRFQGIWRFCALCASFP